VQVRTSRLGVATYLAPDGPLTRETLAALEAGVAEARAKGAVDLVVDLRRVPFADSRALEYLLDLSAELRRKDGSLRLANPGEICRDILAVTGLDQSIPVFADLESAGGSFL